VLKITITETRTENRWILQGQLFEPSVHELRKCWKKKHRTESGPQCAVNLKGLTSIDKSRERLLRVLCKKSARPTANGIHTKHVIEKTTSKGNLSGLLVLFLAGFVSTVISFSPSGDVNANVSHLYALQGAETLVEAGASASRLSPYGADALDWVGLASRPAR
jgi:hypothetical protein